LVKKTEGILGVKELIATLVNIVAIDRLEEEM
jgi:hypothetical protein